MESDDTFFLPTRLKFAWLGLGGLLKAPCSRRVESRGAAWAGGIFKSSNWLEAWERANKIRLTRKKVLLGFEIVCLKMLG